ncbi:MAG: DUF6020 family protein [Firmicutes bacterium]|nr:DUF6020 family protein [Bacillota bacterium]
MNTFAASHRKLLLGLQTVLILIWLINLTETDSYYSVYLLCTIVGVYCMGRNARGRTTHRTAVKVWLMLFSALFSFAVILANWQLFVPVTLLSAGNAALSFLGGMVIGIHVLRCLLDGRQIAASPSERRHPALVFLVCFGVIAAIDLIYLFFAAYPGVLTLDSIGSIREFTTGGYSNVLPFWYTVTVQLFYEIGFALFGEANAAVAFFCVWQVLFLTASVAYMLVTMYQAGTPKGYLGLVCAMFALLPYHVVYSVTVWKDVLFACGVLLFTTALYRLLRGIGKHRIGNAAILFLGGLGMSLWRTNGWVAFLAASLVMLPFLWKRHKGIIGLTAAVVVVGWVLINPVLTAWNVASTDMVEAFSIPLQQIARVVADDSYLAPEERELLSEALDLDVVHDKYDPRLADPIKWEAFRRDNREYVREHFLQYVRLWLRLGRRYPGTYLKAWVEQTKGYWNGGYRYWTYTTVVEENPYGITRVDCDNAVKDCFTAVFRFLDKTAAFQPLYSIGLHVWILISCFAVNTLRKRKEWLLALPSLVIIAGLWLGTPVFAEFRYAYPIFLTLPLIVSATLWPLEAPTGD